MNKNMYRPITFFVVLTFIGFLFEKYKTKEKTKQHQQQDLQIQQYLLEDSSTNVEPIIWVHVPNEQNARKWLHWGSRNTNHVNQPYLYLCLKTIMKRANGLFKVCMIDDNSFNTLLPNWVLDLNSIPEPSRNTTRTILMMQLLYKYGGVHLPLSFIALRNIDDLYTMCLKNHECFIGTSINKHIPYNNEDFMIDTSIMGCVKESKVMKDIIETYSHMTSKDFTHEHILEGTLNKYIEERVRNDDMYLLQPEYLGLVDNENNPITTERLMEPKQNDYSLNHMSYGIVVPHKDIMNRTKYQWYGMLSFEDVLDVDNMISYYLLQTNVHE